MAELITTLMNGLAAGSLYGLVALGFVLIYKATHIVNLAHGEIMLLGTFLVVAGVTTWKLPYVAALLLALGAMALFSVLLERLFLRHMVGKSPLSTILLTLGMGSMTYSAVALIFGTHERAFPSPFSGRTLAIGPAVVWQAHVVTIVACALLFCAFWLFFQYSRTGLALRAAASNQTVARLMGISARRVVTLTWCIAAVVATVAGTLAADLTFLHLDLRLLALRALPAAILGGLDSVGGAIVGGLVLGLSENLAGAYIGGHVKAVSPFFILLLLLVIRPYGLFGSKHIKRV